jgi:hypothetical protein
MKKLKKHALDFSRTLKYFQENLDNTNILSSKLLEFANFEEGSFFTLLPDNANTNKIYEFEHGGILKQHHTLQVQISEKTSSSQIPTIRDEVAEFILEETTKHRLQCIFDDTLRSPADKFKAEILQLFEIFYDEEIYYFIKPKQASTNQIKECLKASNSFWHSLCILTHADINIASKTLTCEDIKDICTKSDLIILGAYDSEGYIFWESRKGL